VIHLCFIVINKSDGKIQISYDGDWYSLNLHGDRDGISPSEFCEID